MSERTILRLVPRTTAEPRPEDPLLDEAIRQINEWHKEKRITAIVAIVSLESGETEELASTEAYTDIQATIGALEMLKMRMFKEWDEELND